MHPLCLPGIFMVPQCPATKTAFHFLLQYQGLKSCGAGKEKRRHSLQISIRLWLTQPRTIRDA